MKKIILWVFLFHVTYLLANPESPDVKSGQVTFANPENDFLQVTSSDKAIVEWGSFSIDKGQTMKFVLPDSKSSILNRVIGPDMSKISGRLESNGAVYLINKNGIYIDGVINAASFIASTLSLSDSDFLNNKILSFVGDSNSSITNVGKISTFDGDVFLLAYNVDNLGDISANGHVGLGAGKEILLQLEGKEKIAIKIKDSSEKDGVGISHKGKIDAVQVELKADGNPYAFAIKNEGVINAKGHKKIEGRVFLVAEEGNNFNSGKITAKNEDGSGGTVHILGKGVRLYDEAVIDISGETSGGIALIGGDYQGKNPEIQNAEYTLIEQNVKIYADSKYNGDGGKVIVWGTKACGMQGSISSKGGSILGDGGFVEISSLGVLSPTGNISTMASNGQNGLLYLDPIDITVSNAADSQISWVLGNLAFEANPVTANSGTLNITTMLTQLQTTSVTVDATSGDRNSGNIDVIDPIAITNSHDGNTLTFKAEDNFTLSSDITVTSSTADLVIIAGEDSGYVDIDSLGSITYDSLSSGDLTIVAQGGGGDIIITGPTSPSKAISFKSTGTCHLSTAGETINSVLYSIGDDIIINGDIEVENGAMLIKSADNNDINGLINLTGSNSHEISSVVSNVSINNIITYNSGSLLLEASNLIAVNQDIIVNGTGDLTLTSTNNSIAVNGPITMNTTGTLDVNTVDEFYLRESIVNSNIAAGDMTLNIGGDLIIDGTTTDQPAKIGAASGNIFINSGEGIFLFGGDTNGSYAQIGYSGGDSSQNIVITNIVRDLTLQGGIQGADNCYALIGHGSGFSALAPYNYTGDITIPDIGVNLDILGGSSNNCFAQIGHTRGIGNKVTVNSDISILDIAGSVNIIGGTAQGCYALVGHGGGISLEADNYKGSINVCQNDASINSISILSGTQTLSFAGIGHIAHKATDVDGPVTINDVPEIKVEATNGINLSARSLSEAFIGARVIGTSGGTGNINITNIEVITGNGNDLSLENISPDANFHGTVIGSLANIDQSFPITSAGDAVSDIILTIDGNLSLDTALQTNGAEVYTYITNYSGTPNGISTLIGNINKSIFLQGGGGIAGIESSGPLTLNGLNGDLTFTNPVGTDLNRDSFIKANGTTSISVKNISLSGVLSGPSAFIENATGSTTITTNNNFIVSTNSYIDVTGGEDNLTLNIGNAVGEIGDLSLINGSFIRNQGTGNVNIDIGCNGFIEAGNGGITEIISNNELSLVADCNIQLIGSGSGGTAISAEGNTSISCAHLTLIGGNVINTTSINNSLGDLTIDSQYQTLIEHFASINLTGGIGLLKINSGVGGFGDLNIINSSNIVNSGSGNIEIGTPTNFNLIAGSENGAIVSSNGGISISSGCAITVKSSNSGISSISAKGDSIFVSDNLFLSGCSVFPPTIESTTGNMSFVMSSCFFSDSYGLIKLAGGNGDISIAIGSIGAGDSYLTHNAIIINEGTGNINFTTSGNFILMSGNDGDSYIKTSYGDIDINVSDNFVIESVHGGDSYLNAGRNLTVTGNKISVIGEADSSHAYLTTLGGNILATALTDINLVNNAYILNPGSGDITLVVDQQAPVSPITGNGRFMMTKDSYVQTAGGNLSVFSVKDEQNLINGTLNGTNIIGAVENQVYDTYYDSFSGVVGVPFTMYYKIPGVNPSALRVVATRASELDQIIEREMNRVPQEYYFNLCIDTSNSLNSKICTSTYSRFPHVKDIAYTRRYIGFFNEYDKKFIGEDD